MADAKEKVLTSLGELDVTRPTLRGWELILKALPASAYDRIYDAILDLVNTPTAENPTPEQRAVYHEACMRAAKNALSIVVSLPRLAGAVLAACCRRLNGERLTIEDAMDANERDVQIVVEAVLKTGMVEDIAKHLGKALGRRKA